MSNLVDDAVQRILGDIRSLSSKINNALSRLVAKLWQVVTEVARSAWNLTRNLLKLLLSFLVLVSLFLTPILVGLGFYELIYLPYTSIQVIGWVGSAFASLFVIYMIFVVFAKKTEGEEQKYTSVWFHIINVLLVVAIASASSLQYTFRSPPLRAIQERFNYIADTAHSLLIQIQQAENQKQSGGVTLKLSSTPAKPSPPHSGGKSANDSETKYPSGTGVTSVSEVAQRGNTSNALMDELMGSSLGQAYGIQWVQALGGSGARFTAASSSRIEYANQIPAEGTLEFWIKVDSGYQYRNTVFTRTPNEAMIFSTDAEGGDVSWPGGAKLFVHADGNVTLVIATAKYDRPPPQPTIAPITLFRFGQWHALGISYGSLGQSIMVDGTVVASAQERTQALGRAGTHESPQDVPTIGETVSHYWARHQYEGGFEGIVAKFRASNKQQDWFLARGIGD